MITKEEAQLVLASFEINLELKETQIAEVLTIIHRLPHYEDFTFAKAAQNSILRNILTRIAREEITRTDPKDLKTLIEAAEKREGLVKSIRETESAKEKESIKERGEAVKKKAAASKEVKVPTPPVKPAAPIPAGELAQEPVLPLLLTKVAGSRDTANFFQKLIFAPVKLVVEGSMPIRGGSSGAVLSYALVHGITPSKLLPLKGKALALGMSERQFTTFVTALSKQKFMVSLSDAIYAGRQLGIAPQQAAGLFLKPSADRTSLTIERKGLFDRLIGGIRDVFVRPAGGKKVIGGPAAGLSSTTNSAVRFLSGNLGRWSAPWGYGAAGLLAAGGVAVSPLSPVLAAGFFAGAAGTSLAAGANQSDGYENLFGEGIGKTIAFIGALFALAVTGLITAIVIGVIATVGTVAIILFIINAGAYVVPPKGGAFQSYLESPYIAVTKTVDKENVPKLTGDLIVTYEVTIGAKKGDLNNLTISDKCTVSQKDGSEDCPDATGFPDKDSLPSEITKGGGAYTFSYQRTFGPEHNDSLVHDTFTVTADSPEQKGATAQASASFIIGEAPTGCFKTVGDWPEDGNYLTNAEAGIVAIVTKHPLFAAKVCSGGDVTIAFSGANEKEWGYHNHYGNARQPNEDIILYSGGLGNALNAEYIITHEATHHLTTIMDEIYVLYRDRAGIGGEIPLCSYSETDKESEAVAEAAALYGSGKPFSTFRGCSGTGNFQSAYPAHYTFAKQDLFEE